MDFGGNIFCLSNANNREQNGPNNNNNNHSATFAWDSWQNPSSTTPNHSRLINTFYTTLPAANGPGAAISTTTRQEASLENALMFLPQASSRTSATTTTAAHDDAVHCQEQQQLMYSGDRSHLHPDPHLMCLKLGKRHYFEDANGHLEDRHVASYGGLSLAGKRGKEYYYGSGGGDAGVKVSSFAAATVPRCQVEGCHVALLNAKDYHRRHKVCEMHSKAPKVVVLGLEQRFCQQCSRFHVVSEFDDSKRSCRRRLAGHNERRRKSSHDSVARNSSQGCALSLLSSKSDSWLSPADLSTRCSAALRELIAENRAASMARQLMSERDHWHSHHHADAVEEQLKDIQSDSKSCPLQHRMFR